MIFYAGLLLGSPVFAYMGQRYNIARTIGFTVIVWGIVCICSAALQNYTGTMVQRFILGVVEAGVSPLFLIFTSYVALQFSAWSNVARLPYPEHS